MVSTPACHAGNSGPIPDGSAKICRRTGDGESGRAVTPLPSGLVGSNPTAGTRHYSTLAQLVERPTVNRMVPGSSPGGGAKTMGTGVTVAR